MAAVSEALMPKDRVDSLFLPDLNGFSAMPDMLRGLSGCLQQDISFDLGQFMPSMSGALCALDKGNSLALLFSAPGLPPCGEVPILPRKFEPVAKPSISPLHSCSTNSTQETFNGPAASGNAWPFASSSGFSISPFAAVQQPQPPVPAKEFNTSSAAVSGAGMSDRPSSSNNGHGMESSSMDRSKHSDMSAFNSGAESGDNDDDVPGIRRSAREATRASTMATVKRSKAPKEKKKVGRPIAYTGDPNAPHLSEAERRRVKRRIANRESARRVRMRKMEQVEELVVKMNQIREHTDQLQHLKLRMESDLAAMRLQVNETHQQWLKLQNDNLKIQQQIDELHKTYQDRLSELEGGKRPNWNQTSKAPESVLPQETQAFAPWLAT